jgi:four helix bundle protein
MGAGAQVRDYRDLKVWNKAHQLTLAVHRGTQSLPREELFGLTRQIRRASVSIEANLAEGCGRRSDGEMGRFIQIAMGSGSELSCHLLLARDLGLMNAEEYSGLYERVTEVLRMLSALSHKVRHSVTEATEELEAKG